MLPRLPPLPSLKLRVLRLLVLSLLIARLELKPIFRERPPTPRAGNPVVAQSGSNVYPATSGKVVR
jgi:hypothetical protein